MAVLIQRHYGVPYHFRYLARALRAHGIAMQKPKVRAHERNEALVRIFLTQDWEMRVKKLVASGAPLPSWTRQVTRFGPR